MTVNKYDVDEKNTKFSFKNYARGLRYLRNYKWQLVILFIIDTIVMASDLLITKQIQYILDNAVGTTNYWVVIQGLSIMLGLVIVHLSFDLIEKRRMLKINQRIIIDIKNDLFTHIQKLPFEYFDTRPHGKIMVRVTEYAASVADLITDKLLTTVFLILNMILTFVFMIITNFKLTLIVLAGIIILNIVLALTSKPKRKMRLDINNKYSNYSAYRLENLRGMETTQVFNRQNKNLEVTNDLINLFNKSRKRILPLSNSGWFTIEIIDHVVNITISFVGAMLLYPQISVGTIVAMSEYSAFFWRPIRYLFQIIDDFIESMTYLERILETIDEPITIIDSENAKDIEIDGVVEFENVTFSYVKGKKVLDNMNLKVEKNEKIALVGETGSGKSTIANLVCRFYDIDSGAIKIDGINIKDIKLKSLRNQITIMQQENYLFSNTIMENLKYGNDELTDEDIINACKKMNIDSWINKFPEGYNTVLKRNGANLSDGERQILCYARTIINNPKILIFDEATSKMDTKTEKVLQELTKEMIKDKTLIVIAHRLSTIVNSDKIYFLKNKKIAEVGNHEELMNKKGDYYNLYMSQMI